MAFGNQIEEIIQSVQRTLMHLRTSYNSQQQIRSGIRIAIIGSVNAGKSSLFNALLGKSRAIVTNIAGTTRDAIEAGVYKNGNYWTLIDTAGLRQTDDVIEQEGIKRSIAEAQQADIILLVLDGARNITPSEREVYESIIAQHKNKIIVVRNKSDEPNTPSMALSMPECIATSSKYNTNIEKLQSAVEEKIDALLAKSDAPFLVNARQHKLILELEKKLENIHAMLQENIQYELVSYHLQDALSHLAELTGKTISEAGMDAVFREFCVGK